MIEAFRITPLRDKDAAFAGEGARKYGGRWNSAGVPVVYAASHRSLAMLEILVHFRGKSSPPGYVIYPVRFDESQVERIALSRLPAGWDAEPVSVTSMAVGDAWVKAAAKPVLAVPSAVVPEEINYVLNPNHTAFGSIAIDDPSPCRFDPRLMHKS